MKRIILMLLVPLLTVTITAFAQQKKVAVEVLYFKANLACCKARACNTLEAIVKSIIEKNWADGSVAFRQVRLSDTTNNELIKKYNAQSQTLIVVVTRKKKDTSTDVTALLREFATTNDAAKFEKDLTDKIKEVIK